MTPPDGRQESAATHPIFLVHPVSGRTALYLSTPERCAEVSGMSPQDAAATVAYLFEHSTREDNVYRHAWSPGDVVMWDNRCVLHKADHHAWSANGSSIAAWWPPPRLTGEQFSETVNHPPSGGGSVPT